MGVASARPHIKKSAVVHTNEQLQNFCNETMVVKPFIWHSSLPNPLFRKQVPNAMQRIGHAASSRTGCNTGVRQH